MSGKKDQPWERLPKERDPAWQAFVLYRDMPYDLGVTRSLQKVSQQLAKSDTLLKRWSAAYDWVSRCRAYDAYKDEQKRKEQEQAEKKRIEDTAKMDDRHIAQAVQFQRLINQEVKRMIDSGRASIREITDLTRAFSTAVNVERQARHSTPSEKQFELNKAIYDQKIAAESAEAEGELSLADVIAKAYEERKQKEGLE